MFTYAAELQTAWLFVSIQTPLPPPSAAAAHTNREKAHAHGRGEKRKAKKRRKKERETVSGFYSGCLYACVRACVRVINQSAVWSRKKGGKRISRRCRMGMGMATATMAGERGDGEQQCSKQSE
jgi:hypothetical protein